MRRLLTVSLLALLTACGGGEPAAPAAATPGVSDAAGATAPPAPAATSTTAPPAETRPGDPGSGAAPAGSGAADVPGDAGAGDTEAALRLLEAAAIAYREAPALTDEIEVKSMMGTLARDETTALRLGPGLDASIVTPSTSVFATGGQLYLQVASHPERYFQAPLVGDMLTTLQQTIGQYGGVMIGPVLRYNKPLEEVVRALAFGLPGRVRLSGYRTITDTDGRALEQITLISEHGSGAVNFDPATKLIQTAEIEYIEPSAPVPNFRITRSLKFQPVIHATLPEPIEFVPGDRLRVATVAGLRGQADEQSLRTITVQHEAPAPDFELHSLVGERWSLAAHRGSVVVMTFWAHWNVESNTNMDALQSVADWAEAAGHPVEVLALCSLPRGAPPDDVWERAYNIWDRSGFSISCLLDDKGAVARSYGVTSIPTTLVLDAEGRFVEAIAGLKDPFPRKIRDAVTAALRSRG